jgi:hypothetical protein
MFGRNVNERPAYFILRKASSILSPSTPSTFTCSAFLAEVRTSGVRCTPEVSKDAGDQRQLRTNW